MQNGPFTQSFMPIAHGQDSLKFKRCPFFYCSTNAIENVLKWAEKVEVKIIWSWVMNIYVKKFREGS